MNDDIHVLGIAGSLRRGSFNRGLLRAAAELLPPGMTLEVFDLSLIPMFNADNEANPPAVVVEFRQRIAAADALLIATPEYNHSIPGVLKNALDWASRPPKPPASGKPLVIMGAGGMFGTTRAQHHLRQVAVNMNMLTLTKPEVLVTYAEQKFDADGNLLDETTRKFMREQLLAFAAWIRRLRACPD